jgi:hypothetical protein
MPQIHGNIWRYFYPEPQAFYNRNNIRKIVMHQWENLLQYHDKDPMLLFQMTKRAKRLVAVAFNFVENVLSFDTDVGFVFC